MANSTISSGNNTTRFQESVRRVYVRGGRFGPYIGANENSVIQTNRNLKKTSIALVGKLDGEGVEGSGSLVGNEESLSNHDALGIPTYHRNGVLIDNEENEKAEFDLFSEARPALQNWTMELKRDQIIQAMGAIEAGGTYYNYGGNKGATNATAASAANMDTWNTNNQDRILYGAALSNLSAGDHTASLANIDTTNDKIDREMIELAKRMAENANPLIRPIEINDGDEPMFVLFLGSYSFRDLRADLATEQSNALPRSVSENPLWTGGDLYVDNVIVKKVPEIDHFIDGTTGAFGGVWGAGATGDSLATGGDSSSRVGVGFLCGAQAVGFHIGRMATFKRRKEDDYEHQSGVGVTCKHDIRKIFYNNKQHGMVTIFHSAAKDS